MLLYETPTISETTTLLCADRVSRIGDKFLGRVKLDQPTAGQLAASQIGLFVEGFLRLDTMLGRLLPLADKPRGTRSVVLYASKEAGQHVYNLLVEEKQCEPCHHYPDQWRAGRLIFSSIESLPRLEHACGPIDSVILLDPTCMVHQARTLRKHNGCIHDRPQIVANFLFDQSRNCLKPVFIMMTTKRAAAASTDAIARAFCLETFWFLDGPTMRA